MKNLKRIEEFTTEELEEKQEATRLLIEELELKLQATKVVNQHITMEIERRATQSIFQATDEQAVDWYIRSKNGTLGSL